MYRAGRPAGGLPLPRARLGAFTAAVAAVSVLAAIVPWVLLFGRGASEAWMTFRNGGIGMWFLALLDFALPVAVGISGALVVRGKRVPSGLFFGVAVIPLVVSLFFGWLTLRVVDAALSGATIDPSQSMRIYAAGLSEAMSLDIFGGFVTCGNAIIGSVALACAVGSIDVATATRSDAQRPSAAFGAATLVAAAAWFVATIVLTALRIRVVGAMAVCVVLVVGVLVPVVVLAARSAPVLRGWHDPIEARRASGALVVAGLCGLLAVLVLERAIAARVASQVFEAVSMGAVTSGQRARILMELVDTRRWTSIASGIHAVLGTTTFGLALAGAVGPARGDAGAGVRHPVSPSSVMASSVGVFVLAAVFALGVGRSRGTDRVAAVRTQAAPPGITLPLVDLEMDDVRSGSDGTITLRADGSAEPGERLAPLVCLRHGSVGVFADRMATLEMLAKRLPDVRDCTLTLIFAAATEKDRAMEARLGDLAPFARGDIAMIETSLDTSFAAPRPSSGFLTVRALPDEMIQYEGQSVKLPLAPTSPPLNASRYDLVRYVFQPTDTIGHVIRVIVAMKKRFGPSLGGVPTLEIAWPPKPAETMPWAAENANLPSGIRFQTPVVVGRLPPENIVRVVRQNAARIRACYGEGLKRDPKLAGTVRVKFVIDRVGSVMTAQDAASTLPDREVVSCIARAFGSLTFPQPEGGIVVVTYPMTLAP